MTDLVPQERVAGLHRKQFLVEQCLQEMPPEKLAQWKELVDLNVKNSVLHTFLKENSSIPISLSAVNRWIAATRKIGTRAESINDLKETFAGIDNHLVLSIVIGTLQQVVTDITNTFSVDQLTPKDAYNVLPMIVRELRMATTDQRKIEQVVAYEELELSGAHRLASILMRELKGSDAERVIANIMATAMIEIEAEVKQTAEKL